VYELEHLNLYKLKSLSFKSSWQGTQIMHISKKRDV
jgi:hypothetical protein